ncbi:NAD(P)-binding protein [Trichocladium antarcticum]|uniref:NAD(P)-binding protein n=1 Tax=Trichocladium antarcticum TaxID=1450529 RepID=A0AAN6ZDU4_9PEZI|nr:NAD(P)-binding protein [Trichocladium antarcticum]
MAPIPKTMSGILIEETGGVEVLKWKTDLPVPQLQEGQVLVRNDTTLHEGDRVAYVADHAYAEYTAVPATSAAPIPAGVSTATAAAALLQGLTALTFVREAAGLPQPPGPREGPWALVHAAAGGTGGMLVQMLGVMGARVIGTAGGPGKCEIARANGARWVVDSKLGVEAVVQRVKEITGGHGVDVIFDGVGRATFDSDLEMAARKATVAVFGNASGAADPVDILRLGAKNIKLMRPVLFGYIATKAERDAYTKELFDLILAGKVKVKIHEEYPLTDVARAHSDLEGRKTTGKLLLKV